MSRPTYLTIDLRALQSNLQRVKDLAPGCSILAMVKANAYGHGMVAVAHALSAAQALGVASLDEGILLREAGVTLPIVLMEGLFSSDELAEAIKHQFTLVVHHAPQVEMLEQASDLLPLSVWLKINTGMNRLGFDMETFPTIYERLQNVRAVKKTIGLMTHFAEADCLTAATTEQQMENFYRLTQALPGPRSLANSAGILAWPNAHADWVRPGLMLYGASPLPAKTATDYGLKPVMTLSSCLIAINKVKRGDKVGYGGTWAAQDDTIIGVVGVGYGDGYPQFAKNNTPVLVKGVECPLVGRVSMDMLTVDLRAHPDAKIGDSVVLWGDKLPIERVALHNNTSAYEIFTRITSRPQLDIKN